MDLLKGITPAMDAKQTLDQILANAEKEGKAERAKTARMARASGKIDPSIIHAALFVQGDEAFSAICDLGKMPAPLAAKIRAAIASGSDARLDCSDELEQIRAAKTESFPVTVGGQTEVFPPNI